MPTFVPDVAPEPTFVPDSESTPTFVPDTPAKTRPLSDADKAQIDRTGEIKAETPVERAGSFLQSIVRPVVGYLRQTHEEVASQPTIGYGDVKGTLATIPEIPMSASIPVHHNPRLGDVLDAPPIDPHVLSGITNALGESAAPFTSPEGLALLGGVGKLVSAAKAGSGAASWAARTISAWFAAQTAKTAGEQAGKASVEATLPETTIGEAAKLIAAPIVNSAIALGAAELAKKPLNAAPTPNALPTPKTTADALGYLDLSRTGAVNDWVNTTNPRETIVFAKDAVATATERAANTAANDVLGELKHKFDGSDLVEARKALVPAVEAGGNAPELESARAKLESATYKNTSDLEQAHEYINSINFALDHLDDLQPAIAKHQAITSAIYEHATDSGIEFPYRQNYVLHAQDVEPPVGFEEPPSGTGAGMSFKKMRVYDTYADSIASGVVPKTPDAVDLLRSAVRSTQGAVNRNLWTDALGQITDPTNGAPLLVKRVSVTRPDGSTYLDTPAGYSPTEVGGRPMAIQNGYAGLFGDLTQKSTVNPTLSKVNATAKSIRLAIDTYHLGRLAAYQSASELSRGDLPLPSYQKGILLGDTSMAAIRDMASRGEIDAKSLPQIEQDKGIIDLGVNFGLNAGRIADSLHQEWIQQIPVLGEVNKFIFEQFQRGAIYDLFVKEFRHQQGLAPELTNEQVARSVAKDINTRLGNLGSQGIFRSATGRDLARTVFLAPQWNEALIRSEVGGAKQLVQGIVPSIKSGRVKVGLLGRVAGTLAVGQFAANQLINLYTRGIPTWDNPEEGIGSKLSAWIPDEIGSSHGFFLNPTTLPAEVTHLLTKAYERTGDFGRTFDAYIRGRLASIPSIEEEFRTGVDAIGRRRNAGEQVTDAIPVPIAGGATANAIKQVHTGEPSESFPGQFQKQMMATMGLKADTAPSPEQRIYRLADDFKRDHNLQQNPEFYGGDYTALTNAFRVHNLTDATQEFEKLRDKKTIPQILKHYSDAYKYPYTGSYANEVHFFKTLTPEQQQTYRAAQSDRKQLAQQALQFITNHIRTH